MSDFINLAGKFIGLLLTYIVLMVALIGSGVIFQIYKGYYHFGPWVYFSGFFGEIFPFLVLFSFVSFFFQVIANQKFMGHIMVVIFFIATIALEWFGLDHGLYKFGGDDLGTYSDMNGYGHFLVPYSLFKIYWMAFSIIMFIITVIFSVRGVETGAKNRWELAKLRLTGPLVKLGVTAMLLFTISGGYIFYNTNILNKYSLPSTKEAYRADYEKTLKTYEYLPQPKIVGVNLKVELYPYDRNYSVEGYFMLVNRHSKEIDEIHVQKRLSPEVVMKYIKFKRGATTNNENEHYGYYIYELDQPLQPGDSIKMEFKQTYTTKGFVEESKANTQVIYNGTFFRNDHFPTLGYNRSYELEDDNTREAYGLAPRVTRAKRNDPREVGNGRSGGDGYEINFEMVIGTDATQIAIAPGRLQKEWEVGNRKYFHYKMDKPMINFYSIVSARYEVMHNQWIPSLDSLGSTVDLEIYYHKGHEYNLNRMMRSMKMSFDYFTKHFSPYQYRQMRIMEFPRYTVFAQSLPNTIPFSEGAGFIMEIDDKKDVDMVFYITAHEIAHQWWGHQIVAANVRGRGMVLESLAQYSALMVMKQVYSEEKVQQFLQRELNRYLKGRSLEAKREMPLALVENQQYIHYGKGAINLYAFQDYISENKVNLALRQFIRDWNSFNGVLQTDKYATTEDLLRYFREVTPDSMQYIVEDLFEAITLYENKATEGTCEIVMGDQFKVTLTLEAVKYRVDSLGVETPVDINDWIDVGVYGEGEDGKDELIYLEKYKITGQVTTLEILVDKKPIKAGIDPKNKLIDRNSDDNVKDLEWVKNK